jgi:hypothetical protein
MRPQRTPKCSEYLQMIGKFLSMHGGPINGTARGLQNSEIINARPKVRMLLCFTSPQAFKSAPLLASKIAISCIFRSQQRSNAVWPYYDMKSFVIPHAHLKPRNIIPLLSFPNPLQNSANTPPRPCGLPSLP